MNQERLKTNIPATLENKREYDETILKDPQDPDLLADLANDEFASFFADASATPKLLITTSHHPSLSGPTHTFAADLLNVFRDRRSDPGDVHTLPSRNSPQEPRNEHSRTCSSSMKKRLARKSMQSLSYISRPVHLVGSGCRVFRPVRALLAMGMRRRIYRN